jgi:formylglycine-generating enzyme required for sulfatase activity
MGTCLNGRIIGGEIKGAEALTDPLGVLGGSYRVSRGGCWNRVAAYCRAAIRGTSPPTARAGGRGLRLALSPSGQSPEAGQAGPVRPAEP